MHTSTDGRMDKNVDSQSFMTTVLLVWFLLIKKSSHQKECCNERNFGRIRIIIVSLLADLIITDWFTNLCAFQRRFSLTPHEPLEWLYGFLDGSMKPSWTWSKAQNSPGAISNGPLRTYGSSAVWSLLSLRPREGGGANTSRAGLPVAVRPAWVSEELDKS